MLSFVGMCAAITLIPSSISTSCRMQSASRLGKELVRDELTAETENMYHILEGVARFLSFVNTMQCIDRYRTRKKLGLVNGYQIFMNGSLKLVGPFPIE